MARRPRIHFPGGLYHVILRGNNRRTLFLDDGDRSAFLRLLAEGVGRYGYRAHAYCLMPNHVHLALESGDTKLGRGLQNLAFRYARRFNWRYGQIGHVFEGRYKALLVDRDQYALTLIRYIHLNPVRARLVRDPAEYVWSSHRAYLDRASLPWLTKNWVLEIFDADRAIATRRFAKFVDAATDHPDDESFRQGSNEGLLGNAQFAGRITQAPKEEAPQLSLDTIVTAVCASCGLTKEMVMLKGRRRDTSEARGLVALYCTQYQVASLTTVANMFGRDLTTMSAALRRVRDRARLSRDLAESLRRIDCLLFSGSGLQSCKFMTDTPRRHASLQS